MAKEADTLPLQVTLAQNLSRVWEGQLRPKRCGANAWYAAAGFSCNKLAGRGCLSISCVDVQFLYLLLVSLSITGSKRPFNL